MHFSGIGTFDEKAGSLSLTVNAGLVYFLLIKSYTRDSPNGLSRKGLANFLCIRR